MRRAWALALVCLLVTGCSSPARNDRDYELKAASSAEAVGSTVEVVRLAVGGNGKLTRPYLKVLLTTAAEQVQGVNDEDPAGAARELAGLGESLRRFDEHE
ncbi:hypothetical protein ACIBI9_32350 [Nonomuraea sp. NPDC050451]|uniref:hypothetical protein n=1 Tax=Nonomuraea sp. NPDC050451 TaxID=3364364 RepID=UPI003797FEFC